MAQFQNRCFSGPLTLDRYLTGGSDSGPLPHLANILVEYTRDHPVEGKVPITRGRVRYSTDVNSMYILFLFGLFLSTSYMSRLPVVPSRRKLYSDCRKV